MKNKKRPVPLEIQKLPPGKVKVWGIITVTLVIMLVFAFQQKKAAAVEIDFQKDVYLFLHGNTELKEKAINALVAKGFLQEKITVATPDKVGNVGDYMAMLWKPPKPDHIRIQQITKVEEIDPDEIIGRWKGVSREDIDTVSLTEN